MLAPLEALHSPALRQPRLLQQHDGNKAAACQDHQQHLDSQQQRCQQQGQLSAAANHRRAAASCMQRSEAGLVVAKGRSPGQGARAWPPPSPSPSPKKAAIRSQNKKPAEARNVSEAVAWQHHSDVMALHRRLRSDSRAVHFHIARIDLPTCSRNAIITLIFGIKTLRYVQGPAMLHIRVQSIRLLQCCPSGFDPQMLNSAHAEWYVGTQRTYRHVLDAAGHAPQPVAAHQLC